MTTEKRTGEIQIVDEANRKALNPNGSKQKYQTAKNSWNSRKTTSAFGRNGSHVKPSGPEMSNGKHTLPGGSSHYNSSTFPVWPSRSEAIRRLVEMALRVKK